MTVGQERDKKHYSGRVCIILEDVRMDAVMYTERDACERCEGYDAVIETSLIVVVVVIDGIRGKRISYGAISAVWGGLVWIGGCGEDKTKCVLSVEVEAIETFLADEAE